METIIYIPNYIEVNRATALFAQLTENVQWANINYFKRHISYGNEGCDELNYLLLQIQDTFGRNVSGIFMNYYKNGNEYAPYHADKYNCDTCILSLGVTRTLRYKHNDTKENTDFELNNGDLLFIPNDINNNYKHSLLKRSKLHLSRISILIFFN